MTTQTVPELAYGPVGDPDSVDPFERAQARMPKGWHVEGQVLSGGRGYRAFAARRGGSMGGAVASTETTFASALAALPDAVRAYLAKVDADA